MVQIPLVLVMVISTDLLDDGRTHHRRMEAGGEAGIGDCETGRNCFVWLQMMKTYSGVVEYYHFEFLHVLAFLS
jgi:hypothetical protein